MTGPTRRTERWHHLPALAGALLLMAGGASMTHADVSERRINDEAREGLSLTIYNENLAMVRDRRRLELSAGENRLAWRNVSARIQAETALLAPDHGPAVSLLEQNFDYDLLSPNSLLAKYVGRSVEVIHTNPATGAETREAATVLAVNDGVVLRYANRIETGVSGRLSFPDVPDNLRDEPTLVLHLDAGGGGRGSYELSYLTGGLSWKADYVASLAPEGGRMDLSGWVTLSNKSGVAYPDARVQLVAGDVNRVQPEMAMPRNRLMAMEAPAAAPMPAEEQLFEYHLYTLPRHTSVGNQQTKQVALLSASGVPVRRELTVRGGGNAYQNQDDGWQELPVSAALAFANDAAPLGLPLPAGVVRVYTTDTTGAAQFIGEDRIDHTPKGKSVHLQLGKSFDITARRRQTDFSKISGSGPWKYVYDASFEVELKNPRKVSETVRVVEAMSGDWEILSESLPHHKDSARQASWMVKIPAQGSTTLKWRARVRH